MLTASVNFKQSLKVNSVNHLPKFGGYQILSYALLWLETRWSQPLIIVQRNELIRSESLKSKIPSRGALNFVLNWETVLMVLTQPLPVPFFKLFGFVFSDFCSKPRKQIELANESSN